MDPEGVRWDSALQSLRRRVSVSCRQLNSDDLILTLIMKDGDKLQPLCRSWADLECWITPLVVMRFMNHFWVTFGNRRLKALKSYQETQEKQVCMKCIVHDLDGSVPVPHELVAKFLDAASICQVL